MDKSPLDRTRKLNTLAPVGFLLAPLGLQPFFQLLYEKTWLTWSNGEQALFFSLAHGHGFTWLGPLRVLGYLGFLFAPFLLWWCATFLWHVAHARVAHVPVSPQHWALLVVVSGPVLLSLVPYSVYLAILT